MRDIKEMAREVKMPYDYVTGEPLYLEKLEAFANLVRADERNRTWTQEHWTEYERSIAAQERKKLSFKFSDYEPDGLHHNKPYRQLQDNGSKYFGESWDKAEPVQDDEHHYKEVIGGVQKLFSDRRIAIPDALTIADKESPEYTAGWNDCRALILEMRKP